MITVNSLKKSFNDIDILKGISTTFEASKVNLIIGQSGSGKTIFLKCLLDLEKPTSGEILYKNLSFKNMKSAEKPKLQKQIGMVFQGSALFDSMNVEENVTFPLQMFANLENEIIRDKANLMLKRVGLENANKKMPSEISGGMKRRVAIARAIILNPKYLLCDEPNSGLDPYMSSVIDNLIKDITDEYKMVTIINTHDMNSVLEIGDKIILIKQGLKAWEGNKDEIYQSTNVDLDEFISSSNAFKKLKMLSK